MPKPRHFSPLPRLAGSQAEAVRPTAQIWLSASAGAGKTQVLTARVLRLLLQGAAPESILCLTFTKAGAAEMAERVHERLGLWVTLPDQDLKQELFNLGAAHLEPETLSDARRLFARVLDARGGGLRIQTIHSFAQTLLAAFPAEAGLPIGFRPVEGREETQLRDAALAEMVTRAEQQSMKGLLDHLAHLAQTLGEEATRKILMRCALAPQAMEDLGFGIDARVRRWLRLGDADVGAAVRAGCTDQGFDVESLATVQAMLMAAGGSRLPGYGQKIANWRALDVAERVLHLDVLLSAWANEEGSVRDGAGWRPKDPDYPALVQPLHDHFLGLRELLRLEETARNISAALLVGQEYARTYGEVKARAGVVDFADLIRSTVALLARPGIGDWIRYKLDQSIDHILVDEAQDTNADQWEIVRALTDEFFAGAGAKPESARTIFAVGDFKQAIFGFQGTDPREFNKARQRFADRITQADQTLDDLKINESFRSSQPILDVVDAVITTLDSSTLGLPDAAPAHHSFNRGAGHVELFPLVMAEGDADLTAEDAGDEEESWFSDAELRWARDLAQKVRDWTTGGLYLDNYKRPAEPGDVMILLRSRSDLARLIVSRLYEERVPVAGVDRLRLDTPIAVQDLMAAIRFVLQPADDLSLASLLVSPLIGWSQDQLYARASGRKGALWPHLRASLPADELWVLHALLDMADRVTPYGFLEAVLSGPIRGRARMIDRLGEEVRDPIEELLNAALQFETSETPTLQTFLDWFCRGTVDIKRDPAKPENAVRVMTVHGSKGLQAPIVVLADATADPDNKKNRDLDWEAEAGVKLPVPRPKKDRLVGSLKASAEAQDARERQEHWRLLYVGMTRAEEYLFVGGAMNRQQMKKKALGPDCWYRRIEEAMHSLPEVVAHQGGLLLARKDAAKSRKAKALDAVETWEGALPDWAQHSAPEEARPARPLAPSSLGVEDRAASPPPDPSMKAAAQRGSLLHALFERLPAVRPEDRAAAGRLWLEAQGAADVEELLGAALAVIDHPDLAHVFAPGALAEAPIAGVVDGLVIAGIVDRLLVTDDSVTVVDFKTGRRVPKSVESVPDYYKAQMGAYAAVLQGIFPGRSVRAVLLYTAEPRLIDLPADLLAAWRPGASGGK
ncbi:MAG: double-strand break repair helicase AddA [Chakrabartia sp.]